MVCSIGIANKWLSNNDAVHFVLYPKQGKTIKGVVQTEYVFLVFLSKTDLGFQALGGSPKPLYLWSTPPRVKAMPKINLCKQDISIYKV